MLLHHTTEGTGPRLLLLHPVGLHGGFLAPIAERLSKRFTVMRIDLRGHGQSALEPFAHSIDDFADDVHETLGQAGFGPCAVAGFSFGGMTAQALAIRHPDDVSALIALAGPCTQDEAKRPTIAARGTDALAHGMQAVLEATMQRWFTPGFMQSAEAQAARTYVAQRDPRGWAQGWKAIAALHTEPHLRALRMPALCVAGELDVSAPPDIVRRIANAIPGARFEVLAGAPHMLFIEQPDQVSAIIANFLEGLEAKR